MIKLIPRLNYDFDLNSLLLGIKGILSPSNDNDKLYQLFGNKNVFLTNQARTGLRILLNSLGLSEGARIGVQAYNCNTVFNAIHKAGYKAVFIDINQNLTIDINDLKLKAPAIDALIVTHTFGIPADILKIKEVVGSKIIIEDCAHSSLILNNNSIIGKVGDAAIFSIGNAKLISIGEGGIVVVNNSKLLDDFKRQFDSLEEYPIYKEIIQLLKNYLFHIVHNPFIYGLITSPFLKKLDKKNDFGGKYKFPEYKIMFSFRNILISRSHTFPYLLENQKSNALILLSVISNRFNLVWKNNTFESNYFMIPILVESPDKLISLFKSYGIEIGRHFSNSIEWAKSFGYLIGSCPMAEKTIQQLVCIPCHYNLHKKDLNKIVAIFKKLE